MNTQDLRNSEIWTDLSFCLKTKFKSLSTLTLTCRCMLNSAALPIIYSVRMVSPTNQWRENSLNLPWTQTYKSITRRVFILMTVKTL